MLGVHTSCHGTRLTPRPCSSTFGSSKKMKKVRIIVLPLVGIIAGFIAGWHYRQFDLALQENKIAAANLMMNSQIYGGSNLPPQLQEYLKARIYCNVHNYFPNKKGYLLQRDWDFGPVDLKVLGTICVWKEPDEKVWDWNSATNRM
jgi:hypothetical protein